MASKRPLDSPGASIAPPAKKTILEPVSIGSVSTLEEMDMKVLKFQNKKLCERIDFRRKAEEALHKRIDQLEKRQTTDDAVLCIVNRYWNQLDEDVRVLLERFDAETIDEQESKNQSEAVTSFLAQLSSWDKSEIETQLRQRVELSNRAIGKILKAFDRLLQRKEKLLRAISKKEETKSSSPTTDMDIKADKKYESKGTEEEKKGTDGEDGLSDVVREELKTLQTENKRLQELVVQLHQKHHASSLRSTELEERVIDTETEIAELRNKTDDLEYDFEKMCEKANRYERFYADAQKQQLQVKFQAEAIKQVDLAPTSTSDVSSLTSLPKNKLEEFTAELEDQRELATNRLQELEVLQKNYQEALREIERLKMELKVLPENLIVQTTEYKCLQSQFSVLYNECMQIRTQLDDTRSMLATSKNIHLRQIEQMESDELSCQKRLRTEVIQLEDTLAQVRKEYEMLRIEFEQTLAANEQTGPINREMRNLITSLQNHNHQLKGEVQRYKRKFKDAQHEIIKIKMGNPEDYKMRPINTATAVKAEAAVETSTGSSSSGTASTAKSEPSSPAASEPVRPASTFVKVEQPSAAVKKEPEVKEDKREEKPIRSDADAIKDLKDQLKKSKDSAKEMKLLLDMYKIAPKDQRDKAQLLSAEKRSRQEIDELKAQLKAFQEADRKEKRKLAEDDAIKKIKKLEDQTASLQKALQIQKQEEEALLSEMEVTGQAYEEMKEQNIRLIQQLREKDDANFKLMSERIKSNQIHKLLKEEKDVYAEQVTTLHAQVEAQNLVVRALEEKERILQNNLTTVEKEASLRQQASEMYKRKAMESAQTAADLKLHLDKYQSQLREAQLIVQDKTSALEQDSFKHKRIQEEVATLRKKLERHKKIELAGGADEVLMEEIKEYKEQLTCPSCKVKRKNAVLTKCFHVFCLDCLKTRYETRQRKCPKCNAGFGANDYHRIYIS